VAEGDRTPIAGLLMFEAGPPGVTSVVSVIDPVRTCRAVPGIDVVGAAPGVALRTVGVDTTGSWSRVHGMDSREAVTP
jgi:hypothetical protein